jgi:hypothetical protein
VKAIASPIIEAEMRDWTALGGQNWGILGAYDGSHPTGFHRAGFEVPPSDYSRRHDPGKPYAMEWASAGDFAHLGRTNLRAVHAGVLARLMASDPSLSMIVEFIGQPWPDKPVMYWARWDGVNNLRRYTGKGHDQWSHISWQRSRGNERAYLWKPAAGGSTPTQSAGGTQKMIVIAKQLSTGKLFVCDGVTSRPIPEGNVGDLKWLAGQGAIGPLWKNGEIYNGWLAEAFGTVVGTSGSDVALSDEQVQKLAAVLAARPDNPLSDADVPVLVRAFKQAAREGAGA